MRLDVFFFGCVPMPDAGNDGPVPTTRRYGTDAVVAERGRVSAALRDAGYDLPPSQANFVWLPLVGRAQQFAADAANNRVIVRPYGEDGVRVTVASPQENDVFLEFARRWIGAA